MNASYKIALLAAFAVLAIVVAYYAFFSGPEDTDPLTSPTGDVAQAGNGDDDGDAGSNAGTPGTRPSLRPGPGSRPAPPDNQPDPPTPQETDPGTEVVIGPQPGQRPGLNDVPLEEESETPGEPFGPSFVEQPFRPSPGVGDGGDDPVSPIDVQEPSVVEPEIETEPEIEPEPEIETPPSPTAPRTYTVVAGDTLSGIAVKVLGQESAWVEIAQANPSVDPLRLRPGQVLVMPSRAAVEAEDEEPAPPAPGQNQTYTIQPGDTLSEIASRFYDDPNAWQVIYNRNRDRIGPSPDRLKTGMQLIIPPRYDGAQ